MSRYKFELATPADDPQLRLILSRTPMPGSIAVAFGREPSYFDAAVVEGSFRQSLVVCDTTTGQLVGVGARSVAVKYVNGRPIAVGYLSNLRLLEEHRRNGLLARGYRYLRDLHDDRRTQLYLTTVAEDNTRALDVLASGRAGLPSYHPQGRYHTLAIPLRRYGSQRISADVEIRTATMQDVSAIIEFLDRVGPQRQFFPRYLAGDFVMETGILRGLRPADVLLAFDNGRLTGMLAGWDQTAFRQDLIHGYAWPLNWLRPAYNVWAGMSGRPRLPRAGEPVKCLTAALPVVENSDPNTFAALLRELLRRRGGGKWDYLMLGLHESDPLLAAINDVPARRYTTRLFVVCWGDGEELWRSLDSRPPYLELGSL